MAEGNSFLDKVVRPVVAEFIGTTLFVFTVCLFPAKNTNLSGLLQGFAYVSLIAGLGKFSGGHFNPAITAAVTLCGGVPILVAVCYILAQMLGGLIGASLVFFAFLLFINPLLIDRNRYKQGILSERDYNSSAGGATVLSSRTEPGWGVVTEAILTFMLILTVLMTTMDEKKNKLAPLAIGFAVTVGVMAGESVTGGSMNPARSLGPAVSTLKYKIDGVWEYHYIYWFGPLAGVLVATLIYRFLFETSGRQRKNPYLWSQSSTSERLDGDLVLN